MNDILDTIAGLLFLCMLAAAPFLISYWPNPEDCPLWLGAGYGICLLVFFVIVTILDNSTNEEF